MDSRKNSAVTHPAALITTCIFLLLLLLAGGTFFVPGILREGSISDIETDDDSLYSKLGIDIVMKVLNTENTQDDAGPIQGADIAETATAPGRKDADTVSSTVSPKSPATATNTSYSATGPSGKETTSGSGQAALQQGDPATTTDKSVPAKAASASSDSENKSNKKASEKESPEKKSSEKKESEKDSSEKDSAGKESSEKKESEKDSDEMKKIAEAQFSSVSKESDPDNTEDSSKEDNSSDPKDSLTKQQKKHIKAWEDFHGYPFTINAPLNDYNWKYLDRTDDGRLSYEGDDRYTILQGIDVSEFQGKIDWEKVKKAGFDFAFIRAGYRTFDYGNLNRDSRAVKNLRRAKKAGLEVGLYFFSQAITEEEARKEAQLCLDVLEESGVELTLPIAFDPEIQMEYDARINYISKEQFTDNAVAFCRKIKKAGYIPAIYANSSTETDILDMSRLDDVVIWYADYNQIPESPYRFTFWQYSETGSVDGVPEPATDLNVWFIKKDPDQ